MTILKDFLFVGAGGFIGAVMRYGIWFFFDKYASSGFPFATMTVNVTGSFFIGILGVFLQDSHQYWKLFLLIGVLGGFTTFSSFSHETLVLLNNNNILHAFVNVILTVFLCLLFVYIGFKTGKYIFE